MKTKYSVSGIRLRLKRSSLVLFLFAVVPVFAASLVPGSFVAKGPTTAKRIALSFDDGPGPQTAEFLPLLDRYHVKATFFMLGEQVHYKPDVAKTIAQQGHEIASHTSRHINYLQRFREIEKGMPAGPDREKKAAQLAKEELLKDMKEARKVIEDATGVKLKILRMPYGIDRPWIKDAARECGFILVNWTYGVDWLKQPEEEQKAGYIKAIQPGVILLLHDGGRHREKTLRLTEAVLQAAQEKGFEVVTVGELLGVK